MAKSLNHNDNETSSKENKIRISREGKEKAEKAKDKKSFAEFFDDLLAEREYAYGKVASLFIAGSPFEKIKYVITKFLELVELNPNVLNDPYNPKDYGYLDCIYLHTKFIHGKFIGWKCGNKDSPYETDKAHFEVTYNDGKTRIKAKGSCKLVEPEECLKCQSISRLIELESKVIGKKAKRRRKKRAVLIANYDKKGRPIPATQKAIFEEMKNQGVRGSDSFFKKALRGLYYSEKGKKWLPYDDTKEFNRKYWHELADELGIGRTTLIKIYRTYEKVDPTRIVWHRLHGYNAKMIGNAICFAKK